MKFFHYQAALVIVLVDMFITPPSSGHVFRCHWHAKIHVIHGSTLVYDVVGGSAEHALSDHALYERLGPAMERFWLAIGSADRVL